MNDDLLGRLETWRNGHKSRSVQIGIDNGYGATCWTVDLCGKGQTVHAAEVSFFEGEGEAAPDNVVFVQDGNSWPGLHATLAAALERAETLGL
jgi:hypothetical protein